MTGRTLVLSLVALATGILAWIAIESLLERRSVPDAERAALEARSAANLQSMQDDLAQSVTARTSGAAQTRLESPRGQALFRMCAEWTEFHENHPGEETVARRDEACRRFKAWVDDGVAPAND